MTWPVLQRRPRQRAPVFLGNTGANPKLPGGRALGLKPPVAGCADDLGPSELKDLEFAPERPAAELPEAKFPPAEPLGQLVGVTNLQRLQGHERLLLPHSIVASSPGCSFPTCIVPRPKIGLMRK